MHVHFARASARSIFPTNSPRSWLLPVRTWHGSEAEPVVGLPVVFQILPGVFQVPVIWRCTPVKCHSFNVNLTNNTLGRSACGEGVRKENRYRKTGPPRSEKDLCHSAGGELEQIQFLLGHVSVQTTERYLRCKQRIRSAVNDHIGIEPTS